VFTHPPTPGAPPLPKTEDEVQLIYRLTAGARRVNLMRENATVESVREGMMESNWIHLACHGQQNLDDPMESGFLLHDRTLKLSEIVKMSLPKADFAFLSACQTAMGDEKLVEESVHLAAGMLLLGCRGVIATMWSIRDEDGPKIAEDVYSRIFKDGKPNRKEAAYALHEAVKRLRESGAECTSWVPFIHIGR
jgi:CHAT domain-containing protein